MSSFFRRDANILPPAGTVIAEFSNATDAYHFARSKGPRFTVTAGRDNFPFVVRVAIPESPPEHVSGDSAPAVHTPVAAGGFRLIPLTQKGADNVDRINEMLSRLPHGGGEL